MRNLRWSAALVVTLGVSLPFLMPERAVIARRAPRPVADVARLEVFHTAPVLVRAGESVQVPVDVVCAAADGSACPATAVLRLREPGAGWRTFRAPASTGLRFDLSAPVGRALRAGIGTGSIGFEISAQAVGAVRSPSRATAASSSLRVYVTEDLPTVSVPAIPFGRVRRGHEALFLPWGTGSHRAGLRPGNESPTLGPSSFDVGRRGAVVLVDALQSRVAEFRGDRLVRQVRLRGSSWADVAVAGDGTAFLASRATGSSWRGTLRAIDPAGHIRAIAVRLPGMPSEIALVGGSAVVRMLPLDAWVTAGRAAASRRTGATLGRPLGPGRQLLVSGTDGAIRIGTVEGNRVRRALELVPRGSHVRFGEVALAEPDGKGGFVIVVHVRRDRPKALDRYQVIRVDRSLRVRSFLTDSGSYATSMALSRFRLAPDGSLYQMRTEPDGVHIVRYGSGRRQA